MITPVPAFPPDPVFDKWATQARKRILEGRRANTTAEIEWAVAELIRDGQEYAAARVERCARPDDRWGPQ
jgi:hypothetical protein